MKSLNEVLDNAAKKNTSKNAGASEEPDDMELTLSAPVSQNINASTSIYDNAAQKRWGGINTAPSAFERLTKIK